MLFCDCVQHFGLSVSEVIGQTEVVFETVHDSLNIVIAFNVSYSSKDKN